ncbi:MAG: hypothetical protein ACREVX_11100 [Clostridium sp.]|uniref:hypothetical protein n=1 Tax=Clostridium sp. TaxID=1506 RepID=UPI003D6D2F11
MDILYVYNKKARESYGIQAIFNKICGINNVSPDVRINLAHLKKNNILKNNAFLLLDKIRKIVVFK